MRLSLFVPGEPIPQGSTRSLVSRSTQRVITLDANPRTRAWRFDIATMAVEARPPCWPQREPVVVSAHFTFARPKGHYGARGQLRPSAPMAKVTRPDLDKLARAVLDALTGVLWADDSQVVGLQAGKGYATESVPPGLALTVRTTEGLAATMPLEEAWP